MPLTDDRTYPAHTAFAHSQLSNADIRDRELERSRHALAYLKRKLGNNAMRDLLQDDLNEMTAQVRGWVEASQGRWQIGELELVLPGPDAAAFRDWYTQAMAGDREAQLRAGHPEHFISHPDGGGIEVVENIGETELPWRIFYRALPEGETYPFPLHAEYPVKFGSQIEDGDGLRVGYTMHQGRDEAHGMHLKLTTALPAAAPQTLVERHLHHFAIEFRNWTRFAYLETQPGGTP